MIRARCPQRCTSPTSTSGAARHRRCGHRRRAVPPFEQRFGRSLRGVLVQSQQSAALELLIGALRDPTFGPLIVVGAGGSKPSSTTTRSCSLPPSPGQRPEPPSRACVWHRCSMASAAAPSFRSTTLSEFVHRLGLLAATAPEIQQLTSTRCRSAHRAVWPWTPSSAWPSPAFHVCRPVASAVVTITAWSFPGSSTLTTVGIPTDDDSCLVVGVDASPESLAAVEGRCVSDELRRRVVAVHAVGSPRGKACVPIPTWRQP